MTLANCIKRMNHFRALGREKEALVCEERAVRKGYVPKVKEKLKEKPSKK